MSDVIPQVEKPAEENIPPKGKSRRHVRLAGLLLIIFSVLVGWFLLIGFLGWQSGQHRLTERQEEELAVQLERQVTLAQENIAAANYSLAVRRLDWVLARDADYPEAAALRSEAQNGLGIGATATPVTAVTSTPPSTAMPSVTPGPIDSPESELQRIRRLVATKSWDDALAAITAFQRQFPSYERPETDQLLYDVYVGYGLDLVTAEDIERGLFFLDQAAQLGDLSQSVIDHQTWAELYTQGISFYGVNWDAAAYYFRDLCLAAPFYQSSCEQLFDVLVNYGDQYSAALDYCPAVDLYQEALQYQRTTTLVDKLEQAQTGCLQATPTPTGVITDTVPITDTEPLLGEPFVLPSATPDSATP